MNSTLLDISQTVLVIGYGNDLLSDDAVGQKVADEVAAWEIPHVRSLAVHQLAPELADMLAESDYAIFVDSCLMTSSENVKVESLEPVGGLPVWDHTGSPRSLLALTLALYGHSPQAWLVTVPGINFDLGENLSPVACRGMAEALEKIDRLIGN